MDDILNKENRRKLNKIKADGERIDVIFSDKARSKTDKRAFIANYNEKVLEVIEDCDKEKQEKNEKINHLGDDDIKKAVSQRLKGRLFFILENDRYDAIDWRK